MNEKRIKFEKYERQQLLEKVAKLISDQNVVGWYQGRMEWGPRALGNRSILSDPRNAKMKDILNEKIKHREGFRPFAPSIMEEYASEYFDLEISSPYMLLVTKVKKPDQIPAVTHVDGTARVQTVSEDQNKKLYKLLLEVDKITGFPILLNTSFNRPGEPIVESPNDALSCYSEGCLDYLFIGNILISR